MAKSNENVIALTDAILAEARWLGYNVISQLLANNIATRLDKLGWRRE